MKVSNIKAMILAAVAGGLAVAAPSAEAQSLYTWGHADIGLAWEDEALHAHWHLSDGAIVNGSPLPDSGGDGHEFEASELIAQLSTLRNAPDGAAGYLGVAAGTPVYVAGLSAYQPYVGFGTEELDSLEWTGDIIVSLEGWTTPDGGEFALYTTNGAGTSTVDVAFSTFNPSASTFGVGDNAFWMGVGGHEHFQFGFTAPGEYTLTLLFSGNRNGLGIVTTEETFTFNVVPEPSTYALMTIGLVCMILLRRRRVQA